VPPLERVWSTSAIRQVPPLRVTASGWAPPMPPHPAVTHELAGERAAEVRRRAAHSAKVS
jgi:hypothetical protein